MNTKDREYMENLNNSIAQINKSFVLLAKKLSEMGSEWEQSFENLEKAIAGLKLDTPNLGGLTTTSDRAETKQSTPATVIDYNGWEEESQKELHPMIQNNKFVDDGTLFQDEEDATPSVKPSPRRRDNWESNLVSATCTKCGKSEKINKLHATGTIYSCGRCTRR